MKKTILLAAMLTMVLAVTVPSLATSDAGVVDCAVAPADPADMCFENAFFPTGYPVVVGPELIRTGADSAFICGRGSVPEGALDTVQESYVQDLCNVRFGTPLPPGYHDPGQILGLDVPPPPLQYDNADTGRCSDPLADHRGCSSWINPDGSLSQA